MTLGEGTVLSALDRDVIRSPIDKLIIIPQVLPLLDAVWTLSSDRTSDNPTVKKTKTPGTVPMSMSVQIFSTITVLVDSCSVSSPIFLFSSDIIDANKAMVSWVTDQWSTRGG